MARKKGYSRMKKIEPAVQTFSVVTPTAPADGTTTSSYLDLSQIACLLNRRFYRQGINWAVSGFKILSTQPASISMFKLPETWVMSNSWEKSFRTWQKMNDQALEESPSVKPRFLDFKIYADADHHAVGFAANLLPVSLITGNTIVPGEWESSKIVVPKTLSTPGGNVQYEILATGANYPGVGASGLNAVSAIEGYAASRSLPAVLDPNAPSDATDTGTNTPANWMGALFNEGTTQDTIVLGDMVTENNIAPYPFENDGVHLDTMYPNGANQFSGLQLHDTESITTTTIGGMTRIKGGMFPCGLIRVDHLPTAISANLVIQVDLVPGNHRGYLCEPMTEM